MNRETKIVMALYAIGFAVFLIGLMCVQVFYSYQESKAFNRLTGANTTWWDAMWVELRVQEPIER